MAYLGASDVAWGGWSQLDIDGYITYIQVEHDQDEVPSVHDEWSSEDDITPDEDSGDEYLPPGATGGGERESDRLQWV